MLSCLQKLQKHNGIHMLQGRERGFGMGLVEGRASLGRRSIRLRAYGLSQNVKSRSCRLKMNDMGPV